MGERKPERISTDAAALVLGISKRDVIALASEGMIAGAAKFGAH